MEKSIITKRLHRRWHGWIGLLVGLALMSAALWQFNRRIANNLLDHATRLTAVPDWQPRADEALPPSPFFWLSEHEILFYGSDTGNGYPVYRQQVTPGPSSPPVPLPILPPQSTPGEPSPDGKWLVWRKATAFRNGVHGAVALDGSRTVTWPASWAGGGNWMPDSRRWIATTWGDMQPMAEITSVNHPGVEAVPLGLGKTTSVPQILGFTPQGRAIGAISAKQFFKLSLPNHASGMNYPEMQLLEFGIGPQATPPRFFMVRVPPGADYGTILLSPQGDRLAWDCFSQELLPMQQWLHRLIRAYNPTPHYVQHWWVSRLDGSAMHEIGRYEAGLADIAALSEPQWTPDGTHLSFIYKHALYTVPVD